MRLSGRTKSVSTPGRTGESFGHSGCPCARSRVPRSASGRKRTFDYRHEAIQRWLDDVRSGRFSANVGKPFVWRGHDVIGRGWAPQHGFYDSREVRVVLKFDPSFEAGYRVQAAFPQIEKPL